MLIVLSLMTLFWVFPSAGHKSIVAKVDTFPTFTKTRFSFRVVNQCGYESIAASNHSHCFTDGTGKRDLDSENL
ncbi:hypothetical protein KUF71_016172 [Frankliniella fusca]|uniref:DUF1996 domain-containing protein n=1 Tax=Frankliniella fusca TaxID=407009 RepID=A0AAE1HUX1_9NEOP|nr:hypothetical protein KUF71_009549 [Frankliniella fusca]KAK3927887.1 hypothetical protein KUF71_016172 [Frankliniella fusca]